MENKEQEIFNKHGRGFILEKLEQTNRYFNSIVNQLLEKGYKGINNYELDLLVDIKSLLINLEFANNLFYDFGRQSLTDFIEEANKLYFEIREIINNEDKNIYYMKHQYEKYEYYYKQTHGDFRQGLGQMPN